MDDLRRIELAEAGEGIVLVFENADIRALSNTFGKKYHEIVVSGLMIYDLEVIDACLKCGSKKDGKAVVVKFDALKGVRLQDLAQRLLDAFTLCVTGRTYLEEIAFLEEELRKREASGKPALPPESPEDSSASSDELLTGQGSAPPNSGA